MNQPHVGYSPVSVRKGAQTVRTGLAAVASMALVAAAITVTTASPAHARELPVHFHQALPGEGTAMTVTSSGSAITATVSPMTLTVSTRGEPRRVIDIPGTSVIDSIALSADDAVAYVVRLPNGDAPDGAVNRVDMTTGEVTSIEGLGYWPSGVGLTSGGDSLVVTVTGQATVAIVDTATNSVRTEIRLPFAPSHLAVAGNTAYVAGGRNLALIDVRAGIVMRQASPVQGEITSLAVSGDLVFASVWADLPNPAELVALNATNLSQRFSRTIPVTAPDLYSTFTVVAGYSRVYARWGMKWDVGGEQGPVAVLAFTSSGFANPELLVGGPSITWAMAMDPTGTWLGLTGPKSAPFDVMVFATDDAPTYAASARASLAAQSLRITGRTTGFAAGTVVTVHLRTGKKFVAQKKKTQVRANGTFAWRQAFRGKSARFFVTVGDPRAGGATVRTPVVTVRERPLSLP